MGDPVIPVEKVKAKIAEIDNEIRHLQARRADLMDLLGGAVTGSNGGPPKERPAVLTLSRRAPTLHRSGNGAHTMTEAILSVVEPEADGLVPHQIVDKALPLHKTSSNDPRRMVFSYIASMRKDGRLERNDAGKLRITEKGRAFLRRSRDQ